MRRNYNPAADSSESDIPDALAKLGESVRQASRAAGDGAGTDEALSAVQRFRARLQQQQMAAAAQGGKQAGSGQAGSGQAGSGEIGSGQPGSGQPGSGQSGGRIDPNALARGGASGQDRGGNNANGGVRTGGVRDAGGGAGGYVDGGWNTGNNGHGARGAATPETGPTPADREKNFEQGLVELQNVRRAVADDPVAKRQVEDLIRSMQQLDPRRFPGNPEVVDQLFAEVRSGVDRLELQLGHDPAEDNRSVVRNAESLPVPEGYQDAVAEYYRRLSKGQ
jgi:hypothetical protein